MTTDEAIALAKSRGWAIWSLGEKSDGSWKAQLLNPERNREVLGKPGFNDAFTVPAEGDTAAEAILRALSLRYDRETGKVVEIEVLPFSRAAEGRLIQALSRATEARYLTPLDLVPPGTWAPFLAALDAATRARSRRR